METEHNATTDKLIEELLQRLDNGVSWPDGRGHLEFFEAFGDEARERVTFFVLSRNGKPVDETVLFAYLKYMRIADSSAAHIPVEALRRCDPIFDDFANRVGRLATRSDGNEDDEVITRASAAWAEAVNAMIAERVPEAAAAPKASREVCWALMHAFGNDKGFDLYEKAIKRFPVEQMEHTAVDRHTKIEYRNRRRVETYIEEVHQRHGRTVIKKEIYAAAGCSRRTFESWERGETRVSAEMAGKIAGVLANLDYFKK